MLTVAVGLALMLTPTDIDPYDLAENLGVEITYSDAPCAEHFAPNTIVGCYWPDTQSIEILSNINSSSFEEYAVLHELGHYIQDVYNLEFDECQADRIAYRLGANFSGYECPGMPVYGYKQTGKAAT
jgi:hypothetical protein